MKENKPTYITDLTTEIMNNRDLLNAWAKHSADMEFLELSVDILSDLDLLFCWDCDNVLKIKLAAILSGNQDFKWKDGILIKIDESYKFPIKPSEYKKIIKEMIDAESIISIIRKDKLNEGQSLEQIKEEERYNKIASYIDVFEKTKGYESSDFKFLNENLLPKIIERNNELKRQFLGKKADEFMPNIYKNQIKRVKIKGGKNENLDGVEDELLKQKKLPEKWYALLYWIELSADGKQPPTSKEGDFIRKDIEQYRAKITGKSGQSFYRSFIQIDLNNAILLKNSFGSDWKNEIINLSNNNPKVTEYIQSKYTLYFTGISR